MAGGRRLDGQPVPEAQTSYMKLAIAYFLLFVGGAFGLHLAYLGRQNQAIVWCMTFGMFGFGFLRDIFTLPRYVREATGDESMFCLQRMFMLVRSLVCSPFPSASYLTSLQALTKRPPISAERVIAEGATGMLMACLGYLMDIDSDVTKPTTAAIMSVLVSFGVFLTGNIGTQLCRYDATLLGAVAGSIFAAATSNGYEFVAPVIGAVLGALSTREHRLLPQRSPCGKRGICSRFAIVAVLGSAFWTIFLLSALQHGTVTVGSPPEKVKIGYYVREHWSEWRTLWDEVNAHLNANNQSWWDFAKDIGERVTSSEDKHFRTLGLEPGAEWVDVKKAYKGMARQYHPDKVRGSAEEKKAAEEKFMEIQKAYEALSLSVGRTGKANKAQEQEEPRGFSGRTHSEHTSSQRSKTERPTMGSTGRGKARKSSRGAGRGGRRRTEL